MKGLKAFVRTVGRTVVDGDDFQRPPRLLQQGLHAPFDPIRTVAYANGDRDKRCILAHHFTSKALRMVLHRSFIARVVRCTIRPQPGIPNTMTAPNGASK